MNTLVGPVTSYKSITISNFIKKYYPNIDLYTFDYRNYTNFIFSKHSTNNFVTERRNINHLIQIIEENNIDLFLPVINDDIKYFIKHKNKFNGSLDYLGSYEIFTKLNNKKKLMEIASEIDINIPLTFQSFEEITPPCVIKPTNLSSSEGVMYINTHEDLDNIKKEVDSLNSIIAQEYIEGTGVGYSAYSENGDILQGYGHKRLAEYPVSGGSSVYRKTYNDSRMNIIARKILDELPWTGFAMFEFKLTPDNELYLIEVNPRIWGSINQGLQNGVNYFKPILGLPDNQKPNNKNIKTYLSPAIYYTLFLYLLNLNLKPLITFFKNINNNRPDVSVFDDPGGWISMILRKFL